MFCFQLSSFFCVHVVGFYRSQSQHIATQALQALAKTQHVQLCCELTGFCCKAVIACDHLCPYIVRHRTLLCVLLTHVWKPPLPECEVIIYQIVINTCNVYIFTAYRTQLLADRTAIGASAHSLNHHFLSLHLLKSTLLLMFTVNRFKCFFLDSCYSGNSNS